jgi:hypothetical protein
MRGQSKEICLVCSKPIKGYASLNRKYHKPCFLKITRQINAEKKQIKEAKLKKLKKLKEKERRALIYIARYIPNPNKLTRQQLKDICSSYDADFIILKDCLDLTDLNQLTKSPNL